MRDKFCMKSAFPSDIAVLETLRPNGDKHQVAYCVPTVVSEVHRY